MSQSFETGFARGRVLTLLRLEGLAVMAISVTLYFMLGGVWWLFALLLLVPDLSFLGYAAGAKTGAFYYNLVHNYVVPAVIGGIGLAVDNGLVQQIALIHAAHIGMDRSLGYGLKYSSSFQHTHLGLMGRKKNR